jgi:uncharacterized damage-inducible protein DinB
VTADDARTLLDYHYWARDRVLDAIDLLTAELYTRVVESSFRSVRDTTVHIYSAEWIWYSRWQGSSPVAQLEPRTFPDPASIRGAWQQLEQEVRAFFAGLDQSGLERIIEFKTLNGQPSAAALRHMLQHVVNHASYHRGQLTTLLRQLGAAPPRSMDLIAFYRERVVG